MITTMPDTRAKEAVMTVRISVTLIVMGEYGDHC